MAHKNHQMYVDIILLEFQYQRNKTRRKSRRFLKAEYFTSSKAINLSWPIPATICKQSAECSKKQCETREAVHLYEGGRLFRDNCKKFIYWMPASLSYWKIEHIFKYLLSAIDKSLYIYIELIILSSYRLFTFCFFLFFMF